MVLYPFAIEVAGNVENLASVRRAIEQKVCRRLCIEMTGRADLFLTRAYYAAVRMPDCASNVANAYSQVAFVLTPFIERPIVQEALRGSAYIGSGGAYEAAMISKISPELAAIESHYGFVFSRVPLGHLLKSSLRSRIPLGLRHRRARWLEKKNQNNIGYRRYMQKLAASPTLQDIDAILHLVFPGIDWSVVTRNYAQRWTTIAVGSFLKEFQGKLKW
jgi:hypothetical protein